MTKYQWGGFHGQLVERDCRTGDQIWKVGDAIQSNDLSTGLGIAAGGVARRRVTDSTGNDSVRITYAVETAN